MTDFIPIHTAAQYEQLLEEERNGFNLQHDQLNLLRRYNYNNYDPCVVYYMYILNGLVFICLCIFVYLFI